jgi:hypothetical protein
MRRTSRASVRLRSRLPVLASRVSRAAAASWRTSDRYRARISTPIITIMGSRPRTAPDCQGMWRPSEVGDRAMVTGNAAATIRIRVAAACWEPYSDWVTSAHMDRPTVAIGSPRPTPPSTIVGATSSGSRNRARRHR